MTDDEKIDHLVRTLYKQAKIIERMADRASHREERIFQLERHTEEMNRKLRTQSLPENLTPLK